MITRSFYNVPVVETLADRSSELPNLSEHPLLDEYEPAFRPLVLSGLAAIYWAGQQNPNLVATSPLNNLSYPPLHPDFVRQAATLNKEGALAAQAGAAVLAVTLAYQTWMHSMGAEVKTISSTYQQYETSVQQNIESLTAQWAAGDILYYPGFKYEATDLSARHGVNSGSTGAIRLSATFLTTPEADNLNAQPQISQPKKYYFLNLFTSFNGTVVAGRPGWTTGQVEAGMIDRERFATQDDGVNFDRLAKLAQTLNSLVQGEGYLADTPSSGYKFV